MIARVGEKDSEHRHHWMIATQDGETSNAVCRTCGDKREFSNAYRASASWRVRQGSSTASPTATNE